MTTATKDGKKGIETKFHEVKSELVKVGDVMAFIYYAKVERVENGGGRLTVKGLTKGAPQSFGVDGVALVEGALSADQSHETVVMSRTDVARTLVSSKNMPLTVCFLKKDNTERVLRGRFLGEEPLMGYSWVEDLEKPEGDRIREVNHREIKWLIVGGVKYQVRNVK